jgi:hypothetical protein
MFLRTSVDFQRTTRRYMLENITLQRLCVMNWFPASCFNLKGNFLLVMFNCADFEARS